MYHERTLNFIIESHLDKTQTRHYNNSVIKKHIDKKDTLMKLSCKVDGYIFGMIMKVIFF